jgi:hypothetical protein
MFADHPFPASAAGEIAMRLSQPAAEEEKSCFQQQQFGQLFSQSHRGPRQFSRPRLKKIGDKYKVELIGRPIYPMAPRARYEPRAGPAGRDSLNPCARCRESVCVPSRT